MNPHKAAVVLSAWIHERSLDRKLLDKKAG